MLMQCEFKNENTKGGSVQYRRSIFSVLLYLIDRKQFWGDSIFNVVLESIETFRIL